MSSLCHAVVPQVDEIRSMIDGDLGFNQNGISSSSVPKVTYLYVSDDSQVWCSARNAAHQVQTPASEQLVALLS